MLIFLLIIAGIVLMLDISLIFLWALNFRIHIDGITETPYISILIAARNEEDNLADCLESLLQIDYPADQFEILIGNDNSDDQTGGVAEAYSVRYAQIKNYNIIKKITHGNGKANVLAQLARKAKGDFIFITDADIRVPKQWIRSMLLGMTDDVALVTGTSIVVGPGLLAYMQQIDWLFATGMLKVVSDIGIPVTTMGNNMLIRRSSYEQVGGYETLPFSITEDLELFNAIKLHHRTVNLFNAGVLNKSKPLYSVQDLLIQRKRWLRGAFELPLVMIVLLTIQSSFFVIIFALFIINPLIGFIVLGLKFSARFVFISLVARKLKNQINIFGHLLFEFYMSIFSIVSLVYYFMPGSIEWKGRKY